MLKKKTENTELTREQTLEEEFKELNKSQNKYYEKHQAFKKSWKWGLIIGGPLGLVLAFLIAGCEFNGLFFFMSALAGIAGIWEIATVCGIKNTAHFGFGWTVRIPFKIGLGVFEIFAGTVVLLWVAIAIDLVAFGIAMFGFMLFTFLFPLETLYYALRYKMRRRKLRKIFNTTCALAEKAA